MTNEREVFRLPALYTVGEVKRDDVGTTLKDINEQILQVIIKLGVVSLVRTKTLIFLKLVKFYPYNYVVYHIVLSDIVLFCLVMYVPTFLLYNLYIWHLSI